MTALTDTDLKELKDLINSQFELLNGRIDKLDERIQGLEIGQAKIETRLEEWKISIQKIPDLTEKVGELKNWKQIGLIIATAMISSIFSGTIGGVIGWLIKGGKL
jgi:hypothetical protein